VLAGDALGDLRLTPEGVFARDSFVYESVRAIGAGLVVTLGGGYSERSWSCSAAFIASLLGKRLRLPRNGTARQRYADLAASIQPWDLQVGDDEPLTDEDILRDLRRAPQQQRVLDYYSAQGIEYALERYGVLEKLRAMGFADFEVKLRGASTGGVTLFLTASKPPASDRLLLAEATLTRIHRPWPEGAGAQGDMELLLVDWLLLQDPTRPFTAEQPRLPGQAHPGLGVAYDVRELLVQAAGRLGLAGILSRPSHFHNAWGAAPDFHHLSPEEEGQFLALRALLADRSVAAASEQIAAGRLRWCDGSIVRWPAGEQCLPTSPELASYFQSPSYLSRVAATKGKLLCAGLGDNTPRDSQPIAENP
jgi:hypothetical protein